VFTYRSVAPTYTHKHTHTSAARPGMWYEPKQNVREWIKLDLILMV